MARENDRGVAVRELAAGETGRAYQAMLELRSGLGSEADFVERIDHIQRPEGYRLIAAVAPGEEQAAAVAGFRTGHFLAWGFTLYCDDLSTRAQYRGRGYAGRLIEWMLDEAARLRCEQFHLDSGVGPHRTDAHRLYFNQGLRISSHHFSRDIAGSDRRPGGRS